MISPEQTRPASPATEEENQLEHTVVAFLREAESIGRTGTLEGTYDDSADSFAEIRHQLAAMDLDSVSTRLRSDDFNAMFQAALELHQFGSCKFQNFYSAPSRFHPSNMIEDLLRTVESVNEDGRFTSLMESLAYAATKVEWSDFRNWSHSMCHLFEKYGRDGGSSLLDKDHHRRCAQMIVDEAVARVVGESEPGSFDRLLGGVLALNLDRLTPETLDEPWAWKPESLSDLSLVPKICDRSELRAFVMARTPRHFLQELVVAISPDNVYRLFGWSKAIGLMHDVAGAEHPAKVGAWAESFTRKFAPETQLVAGEGSRFAESRSRALKAEVSTGIFVDVDGTLIGAKGTEPGSLNSVLVGALRHCVPPDMRITVITGGNPEHATAQLRRQGVPERWLPARSKSDFAGMRLQVLIDDSPAAHQTFAADQEFRTVKEFLAEDPWGVLSRLRAEHPLPAAESVLPASDSSPKGREGSSTVRALTSGHADSTVSPPSAEQLSGSQRPSIFRWLMNYFGGSRDQSPPKHRTGQ